MFDRLSVGGGIALGLWAAASGLIIFWLINAGLDNIFDAGVSAVERLEAMGAPLSEAAKLYIFSLASVVPFLFLGILFLPVSRRPERRERAAISGAGAYVVALMIAVGVAVGATYVVEAAPGKNDAKPPSAVNAESGKTGD